jgi:hypothetical protein
MIPITDNQAATGARYEIERAMFDGAQWQLLAGDALVATLPRGNFEFSVEWGKLIFAWWSDEASQSWRVVAYELDRAELRLQATRGMARELAILTLRDPAKWRAVRELENLPLSERRQLYAKLLSHLIAGNFENARVQRATTGADPKRSVVGRYARLLVNTGGETTLVAGVSRTESQAEVDGVIAAGLVWLAGFNQSRDEKQRAKRLWFCLPQGRSQTAIERLTLIDAAHLGARVECFEIDESGEEMMAVRPATQDELLNAHPREVIWPAASPGDERWRGRILSLAPNLIEARRRAGHDDENFAINGLEFARLSGGEEAKAKFGVAGLPSEGEAAGQVTLTESSFSELERLVREIVKYRSADSPDRRHPFYRLRPEAWLESLLRRSLRDFDPTLDGRFVYSQIPTWRGDERSVIDLLTVNHEGRLAVIEIKAGEDAQLPMQGLDYWLRVEQARLRGEFKKRGLFAGVALADRSPLLYLVAPRLRFHRTFATVARCIAPPIEAYQIGVNSNWREGVRIHTRERANQPSVPDEEEI